MLVVAIAAEVATATTIALHPLPPTPTVATVAATIRGGGFGEVGGVLAQLELLGPGDPLVQLLRVVSCPKMRSSLAAISAGSGTPDMVVDAL